jgi:hypothetical protein
MIKNAVKCRKCKEKWKEINGYKGIYLVSNHGRIKKVFPGKDTSDKIMCVNIDRAGYHTIKLAKNNTRKHFKIHRLVASQFLDKKKRNQTEVNHKNGLKSANHACNLEWISPSENIKHAFKTGLKKRVKSRISLEDVILIKKLYFKTTYFHNQTRIARLFGINAKTIYSIVKGKSWRHVVI